jgi:sirohydrochlorin ferrochelatase
VPRAQEGRALVLAAHGSADPRFAAVVDAVAVQVRTLRPTLDVRVGYLDHGPPSLADVVDGECTVVPLLLSAGFHVRVDIPSQAPGAVVTNAVGPDLPLATALAERLREAGYDGRKAVTLAAAGSRDDRALDDVRAMARQLAEHLGVDVTAAFIGSGSPRLSALRPGVVASYLIAPGAFHEAVLSSGADIVSAPIGAHPVLAQIALARYDAAAQVPGRTAPA